jgi:hypothetical protein
MTSLSNSAERGMNPAPAKLVVPPGVRRRAFWLNTAMVALTIPPLVVAISRDDFKFLIIYFGAYCLMLLPVIILWRRCGFSFWVPANNPAGRQLIWLTKLAIALLIAANLYTFGSGSALSHYLRALLQTGSATSDTLSTLLLGVVSGVLGNFATDLLRRIFERAKN